jgi:hypothetical protein
VTLPSTVDAGVAATDTAFAFVGWVLCQVGVDNAGLDA